MLDGYKIKMMHPFNSRYYGKYIKCMQVVISYENALNFDFNVLCISL